VAVSIHAGSLSLSGEGGAGWPSWSDG